jgi:hypothetical protein
VCEDAALGGLLDEAGVARVEEDDHGARCFPNDLVDQLQRVLRAVPEAHQRDVGTLPGGDRSDVGDLDLARDHLMPQSHHDRGHEGQASLALVRDQDA